MSYIYNLRKLRYSSKRQQRRNSPPNEKLCSFCLEIKPDKGVSTPGWILEFAEKRAAAAGAFSEPSGSLWPFPPSVQQHQQVKGKANPDQKCEGHGYPGGEVQRA